MDRQFDLTDLNEKENMYDIVVCYHILEHISQDRKAMGEIFRILKVDGIALIQVPFWDKDTYENPDVQTSEARRDSFGQSDHVRVYGFNDFINRLTQIGFIVTPIQYAKQLGKHICQKYVLNEDEYIFVCRKSWLFFHIENDVTANTEK